MSTLGWGDIYVTTTGNCDIITAAAHAGDERPGYRLHIGHSTTRIQVDALKKVQRRAHRKHQANTTAPHSRNKSILHARRSPS